MRLSSFGGYRLALAALALVLFGAYDSYPKNKTYKEEILPYVIFISVFSFPLRTIENNHDSLRMSVADFFSLPAFYYFNTARNTRRLKSTKIKRKTNKQTRDHHANTEKLSKGETWMEKTASGGGGHHFIFWSPIFECCRFPMIANRFRDHDLISLTIRYPLNLFTSTKSWHFYSYLQNSNSFH